VQHAGRGLVAAPPLPWTEADEQKLLAAVQQHGSRSRAELEKALKRTWGSISSRIAKMQKVGVLPTPLEHAVPDVASRVSKPQTGQLSGQTLPKPHPSNLPSGRPQATGLSVVGEGTEEEMAASVSGEAASSSAEGGQLQPGPLPPLLYLATVHKAPRLKHTRDTTALPKDPVSMAVWKKATEVKHAGRDREVEIHGWTIRYINRQSTAHGKGDMYIWPPSEDGLQKGGSLRSFAALREVLQQRAEAKQTGVVWKVPAVSELIQVEVQEVSAPATWRLAEVRKSLPDGRFQACVYDAEGFPDPEFIEWFSKADEGIEWRRCGDGDLPLAAAAPAQPRKYRRRSPGYTPRVRASDEGGSELLAGHP